MVVSMAINYAALRGLPWKSRGRVFGWRGGSGETSVVEWSEMFWDPSHDDAQLENNERQRLSHVIHEDPSFPALRTLTRTSRCCLCLTSCLETSKQNAADTVFYNDYSRRVALIKWYLFYFCSRQRENSRADRVFLATQKPSNGGGFRTSGVGA